MKILTLIAFMVALAVPAYAGKPALKRKVASAVEFSGAAAKAVYEGLPGAPDNMGDGVLGKEGDLICYRKGDAFHCSVRGEDEETGKVDGASAKLIFEKLPSDSEYEDGANGIARDSMVNCFEKGTKAPFKHNCTLN